jgi:hypothetical protein
MSNASLLQSYRFLNVWIDARVLAVLFVGREAWKAIQQIFTTLVKKFSVTSCAVDRKHS